MPGTYNGIGTHYVGKSSYHMHKGVCDACNRLAHLSSFDTHLCVVILFIPVIPLGRKHVIDQCSSCGSHRVLSLKSWMLEKTASLSEAGQNYQLNPTPENAAILMQTSAYFNDLDSYEMVKGLVANSWSQDADLLFRLGATCAYFGDREDAITFYLKALNLAPENREYRRTLTWSYLTLRDIDNAAKVWQPLLTDPDPSELEFFIGLLQQVYASKYLEEGDFLVAQLESAFPGIVTDKRFQKLRKKRKGQLYIDRTGIKKNPSKFSRALPFALVLAIPLLVYLSMYLRSHFVGVHLVSGVDFDQIIKIDDREFNLKARQRQKIRLSEGEHTIVSENALPDDRQFKVQLKAHGWLPFDDDHVRIINPDRMAILLEERIYYATTAALAPDGSQLMHSGKTFYDLPGIEYDFETFPHEIELPSHSSVEGKDRVYMFHYLEPLSAYQDMIAMMGDSSAAAYLKRHIDFGNQDYALMATYALAVASEDVLSFLEQQLEHEPDNVNWHRIYQDYSFYLGEYESLNARYLTLCQEVTENQSMYLYLCSRMVSDQVERRALILKASQSDKPNPYALKSLGYDQCALGEYKKSLELVTQAKQLEPNTREFWPLERLALFGTGKVKDVKTKLKADLSISPTSGAVLSEFVLTCFSMDDKKSAKEAFDRFMKNPEFDFSKSERSAWKSLYVRLGHYVKADWDNYVKKMPPTDGGFEYLLLSDRLEEAVEFIQGTDDASLWFLLWLFADQKLDIQTMAWENGLLILRKGRRDDQLLADWLETRKIGMVTEIYQAEESIIYWMVLAKIVPEEAETCVARARHLNLVPVFPFLSISKLISDAS